MRENKQKTTPDKYKSTKTKKNRTEKKQQNDLFKLAAPGFRKIKIKRKQNILNRLGPVYDRVNQSGKGLGSNLIKAGFDLGSKAIRSEFGKKIINKGIDNIPDIFKFGVSKIKNKNVKKILSSDIADMVVDETQNRAKNKYKTLFD